MSACNSSGVSIIITSAHLAASATSLTGSFSPSAFFTPCEVLRNATATSLTPESRSVRRPFPIKSLARAGDLGLVADRPGAERRDRLQQIAAQWGQRVIDARRN